MANYTLLAVNDINAYLWNKLQAAGLLDANDYLADGFDTPLVPIIPSQQVPEFNNLLSGETYIVYDTELLPIDVDWWNSHEVVNFVVFSVDYDKAAAIVNFMVDLFRRYDESTQDIREFNITSSNFIFHYSSVSMATAPKPTKTEGGMRAGEIEVVFCYSRITDDSGRF